MLIGSQAAKAGTRASSSLGHGLGAVLAAVILITWPTTTALRLVVLLAGAFALLPWTLGRLRQAERRSWWAWSPLPLGAALLVWSLISAVGSGAPWPLSLYGWYGRDNGILMLVGVLALLATATTLHAREVAATLWWVAAAATTASLVALAQVLGWSGFANPYGYAGAPSLLGNPNFAAAFFAITALISLGLAIRGPTLRERLLAGIAGALQILGLWLATSQQGPVAFGTGLAAGALALALCNPRPAIRTGAAVVGGLAVVSGAAVAAMALAGGGPGASFLRSDTLAIRFEYWKASWATMLGLPAFGTGPDGLGRYVAEFRPESYVALLGPNMRVEAAHSVPLQFGATLGVIGLLLWTAFAVSTTVLIVITAWRWSKRGGHKPWLLVTVAAAWTAYLTQAVVSIDMIVLVALGWTLAGLAVALAAASLRPAAEGPATPAGRAQEMPMRPGAVAIVSSVALGVLGLGLAAPGFLAERFPTISSIEDAQRVLASPMTPCPTRLTVANALASQVDLAAYETLMASAAGADPRCPPMTSLYADVARQAGDLPVALPQSLLATQLDPLDYRAWLLRAQVLYESGDTPEALEAYQEAARLVALFAGNDRTGVDALGQQLGVLAP